MTFAGLILVALAINTAGVQVANAIQDLAKAVRKRTTNTEDER